MVWQLKCQWNLVWELRNAGFASITEEKLKKCHDTMFFFYSEKNWKPKWNLPKIYWGSYSPCFDFLEEKGEFYGCGKDSKTTSLATVKPVIWQLLGLHNPFFVIASGQAKYKVTFLLLLCTLRETPFICLCYSAQLLYCKSCKDSYAGESDYDCSPTTSQFNLLAHLKTCKGYAVIWKSSTWKKTSYEV